MPKIIENLPQRLTEEAWRQIGEAGYCAMTIRSVAAACGVGTGTVYNYFSSKEQLVAAFLLEDWKSRVAAIHACSESALQPEPVLQAIYDNLVQFYNRYAPIFRDEAAAAGFSGSVSRYHSVLRGQLAAPLRRFCPDDFTADFIAESLLTWTIAGKSFSQQYPIICKIMNI